MISLSVFEPVPLSDLFNSPRQHHHPPAISCFSFLNWTALACAQSHAPNSRSKSRSAAPLAGVCSRSQAPACDWSANFSTPKSSLAGGSALSASKSERPPPEPSAQVIWPPMTSGQRLAGDEAGVDGRVGVGDERELEAGLLLGDGRHTKGGFSGKQIHHLWQACSSVVMFGARSFQYRNVHLGRLVKSSTGFCLGSGRWRARSDELRDGGKARPCCPEVFLCADAACAGHASIGADLDEDAHTPHVIPLGTGARGAAPNDLLCWPPVPGPLQGLAQFPVDFMRVTMCPQRVEVPVGDFDFSDRFAGEVGGQAPLPELMSRSTLPLACGVGA